MFATSVRFLLLLLACCMPATESRRHCVGAERRPVRVRLFFGGDLMQHLPQVTAARSGDGFDYTPVFEALAPRMHRADLAVVNLETTLTHEEPYTGYPLFRSPVQLADAMREAGVDVAVLANNHCCDGSGTGIRTTIGALDRCAIRHTGVYADSLDCKANNILHFTLRGIHLALLNYTYGTNGMPVPRGTVVNRIDTLQMAADLHAARSQGAECVAVCIHWGNEYERRENASQRALARFMRRHGADLIIGSHPHVVQPCEADSASVVVYSLGNLVSNQRKRYCDGGIAAEVEVIRHADGHLTFALETVPVWVALPGYRILPPEAADTMSLPEAYRIFRKDTEELLAGR